MKFALPIKFFQAGCVAAVIGFGMMRAEAQITIPAPSTNYSFPAIGTLQKATDYAVKATTVVLIDAWAYKTNSQESYYGGTTGYIGTNIIKSKIQLDQQFIVPGLSNVVLHNFCTNTDPTWDKSKGIVIDVACDITEPYIGISHNDLLWYSGTIQLVKNSDGSWSVPNLSSFSTQFEDSIPFYVPNLQWARVEVGYNGDPSPFDVDDNLYDPTTDPIGSDGYLYLSTD